MSKDYPVGYKKPPKSGQFKPGTSGNKKGRPKGTQNLKTDLIAELGAAISIKEGGKPKTISKQRAVLKSIMAKAISGNPQAANIVLKLVTSVIGADPANGQAIDLTAADEAILASFKAQLLQELDKKETK